jgi:two-component system sensor histidine kinase KdpD
MLATKKYVGVANSRPDSRTPRRCLGGETQRELLESIRDEADRLNRLVHNLLQMTRLESGTLELRRDWHPLEEVVGAALGRLARALGSRHTPPGSAIRIVATATEGRVTVEVADRGPGLPSGQEERVFEKFHRATPRAGQGAGLGLAICRSIVETHGGRIWAQNLPEGGVAFLFTLPLPDGPPAPLPRDA